MLFKIWAILLLISLSGRAMDPPYDQKTCLNCFSLSELKKIIQNDERIMRSAFPDETFEIVRFYQQDIRAHLFEAFPLVSACKVGFIVNNNIGSLNILPLENLWIRIHRNLHDLNQNFAIKQALREKKPNLEEVKIWVKSYIKFFFAPTAYLPKSQEVIITAFDPFYYGPQNINCPDWLRPWLEKAINANKDFLLCYKKMKNINEQLQAYKDHKLIEQKIKEHLNAGNYSITLQSLGEQAAKAVPKEKHQKNIAKEICECLIESYFTYKNIKNIPIEYNKYELIYIHSDLVEIILASLDSIIRKFSSISLCGRKEVHYLDQGKLNMLFLATFLIPSGKKVPPNWDFNRENDSKKALRQLQKRAKKEYIMTNQEEAPQP